MENFESLLQGLGLTLTDLQKQQFAKYCHFLQEYNEKVNLTAITDTEGIYLKHFYDCLLLTDFTTLSGSLCDVGSGAGFPGVVLKIMRPDLEVVLLEPIGKKAVFLSQLIALLDLQGIKVENTRAEEYVANHREQFDFVTARAVASLDILAELCLPLLKNNGHFICMKGPKAPEELVQATKALKILKSELVNQKEYPLADQGQRILIDIVKKETIDSKYPRPYAQIKKKPL